MASFNDLPDDVLWLIFQPLCIDYLINHNYSSFSGLKHYETYSIIPNNFNWDLSIKMKDFATINKKCLFLFKKKCVKFINGWLFTKGALTSNYKLNLYPDYEISVYYDLNKKRKIG